MSSAAPMLPFVTDVMNSLGPYLMTGLAIGLGVPLMFVILRFVRGGTRGWPVL